MAPHDLSRRDLLLLVASEIAVGADAAAPVAQTVRRTRAKFSDRASRARTRAAKGPPHEGR